MACLSCRWVLIRPYRVARVVNAMWATTLFCACSVVESAPITFAFDATVTEVLGADAFIEELPFEPMIGQVIAGKVTFTPVAFGETIENGASMEVVWEGETIMGILQELRTINDHIGAKGFLIDALVVGCGIPDSCTTASFGVDLFEFSLVLGSSQNLVPAGRFMDSIDSWNRFEDRRLLLTFSNKSGTRRMGITASVGQMHAVPEPSLVQSFLFSATVLVLCRPRRY